MTTPQEPEYNTLYTHYYHTSEIQLKRIDCTCGKLLPTDESYQRLAEQFEELTKKSKESGN